MKKWILSLSVALLGAWGGAFAQTHFSTYNDGNLGRSYLLAWDENSGDNKQYYWKEGGWKATDVPLPVSELGSIEGKYRMQAFWDSKANRPTFLVWDSKTGTSAMFVWDSTNAKWRALGVPLPANPIGEVEGEAVIQYYFDVKSNNGAYIIYDTADGRSKHYFWSSSSASWSAYNVNIPANPASNE